MPSKNRSNQKMAKHPGRVWRILFVSLVCVHLTLIHILLQFKSRRKKLQDSRDKLIATVQKVLDRRSRKAKETRTTLLLKSSLQNQFDNEAKSSTLPDWMNDYFTWHKEQKSQINEDNWKDFQYIVMQCVQEDHYCGGASDRLKPIPLLLFIAYQTKRIFLIWWTMPFPLEEFLVPNLINWTVPKYIPLSNYSVNGELTTTVEGLVLNANEDTTIVRSQIQVLDGGSIYFEEHSSPTLYQNIYHDVWKLLFSPAPPIAKILDDEMDTAGIQPGEYAVAHYSALYARDSKNEADITNAAIRAVNCASQLRPGGPIYFASDSTHAMQSIQKYAEENSYRIVTIANQVPLHLDNTGNWSYQQPNDFYFIFVDLYLIGMGNCVSYGDGGIGNFGLLLSYNASCFTKYTENGKNVNCIWV